MIRQPDSKNTAVEYNLSHIGDFRECPECENWINLHRVYLDKGRWVWCRKCGLVLDGHFEGMKEWEWVQWIKTVEDGIGKGELRDIVKVARREGRYKALKQWRQGLL